MGGPAPLRFFADTHRHSYASMTVQSLTKAKAEDETYEEKDYFGRRIRTNIAMHGYRRNFERWLG